MHTPSEGGPEPSAGQLTLSYDAEANVTTLNGYMDDAAGADFTLLVSGTVAPGDLIL